MDEKHSFFKKVNVQLLALGTLLLVALPLTLNTLQERQKLRQQASSGSNTTPTPPLRISPTFSTLQTSASSVLSLVSTKTGTAQAQYAPGEVIAYDVMLDPGKNLPTFVTLELLFDPRVVQATGAGTFVPNAEVFPSTLEGPVTTANSVLVTVSIGADPRNTVTTTSKIGTLYLKALGVTSSPSAIKFGTKSQVLSVAATDRADQNVIAKTIPGWVTVLGQQVPSISPSVTQKPSIFPTTVPSQRPSTSPQATGPTILSFTVLLDGIGNAGDKINRQGKGNENPVAKQRAFVIEIFNSKQDRVARIEPVLRYDALTGSYKGTAEVKGLTSGYYSLKIKTNRHLSQRVPLTLTLQQGQTIQVPVITLTNGDVDDDNKLDIKDYNTLSNCYSDFTPAKDCDDDRKGKSDLNDDGEVNEKDYNLYIREISVQSGD